VHAAPGNAGIAALVPVHAVDVADARAVADLAQSLRADLVVIGPELPLVKGAGDAVRARGIDCFGPSASAARLEGSKAFAKEVMYEAGVPTAASFVCAGQGEVQDALAAFDPPYVVKDDGLAAGKGVVVTSSYDEALDHALTVIGDGRAVVIEEFLDGPEVSLFGVTDGRTVVPLLAAQDFKRVGDGDAGPNTGGMGAYCPLPWAPADLSERVLADVLQPTVDAMRNRGTPFTGLLYAGLALTGNGIRVIEFNARFGDPETQVVLAMLATPLAGLLRAAARGELAEHPPLEWRTGAAVTVVLAAHGYPGKVRTGDVITGLAEAEVSGARVFHAGTRSVEGQVVSAGGRVLSVTAHGDDLCAARALAYDALDRIELDGAHFRRDIAAQAAGQ
jgi:phosphoribosylamine--glycine ligase